MYSGLHKLHNLFNYIMDSCNDYLQLPMNALDQSKWVQSLWCIYQSFIIGKRRRNSDIEITFTYIWFYHARVLRYSHVFSYVNHIFKYFLEKNSNMKYSFNLHGFSSLVSLWKIICDHLTISQMLGISMEIFI